MIEAQKALSNIKENDFQRAVKSFQNTFDVDIRLFKTELSVNYAYCDSLFEAGVLNRLESEKIKNGLQTLSKRSEFDGNYFDGHNFDSISAFIEDRLIQLVGTVGRKINIGRSSKDLNLTVLRYWIRNKITEISQDVREIQLNCLKLTEENRNFVFFSGINSQQNQPILFAQWCLNFFEVFSRDRERLDEVWRRTNTLPLGAKDGNGSSFEIDRETLARKLDFEGVSTNDLDAVNDRDFVLEFINASTLLMFHLQKLADNLLFYSSEENPTFKLNNRSQEKALSLIIENGIRLPGFQSTLNSVLYSFSTNFQKDFSRFNKIIFETADILANSLKILDTVLSGLTLNFDITDEISKRPFIDESEIFEYLIHRGLSFESAENTAGKIRKFLENKIDFADISFEELSEISSAIEPDIFDIFEVKKVLGQKDQIGGTSAERISEAIDEAEKRLRFEE